MNNRHKAREIALQILYRFDVERSSGMTEQPKDHEMASMLSHHFEHFKVAEPVRAFAAELVAGTLKERLEIDSKIESLSTHWRISRMGFIDRNLIRMALYEMIHCKDVPRNVTIDEAIELAKQFGTQESPSFINGVLDAFPKAS